MNTIVKVGRLHLADRFSYTWLVWGVLAFTVGVNLAIFSVVPREAGGQYTGAILTIFIFMIVAGTLSVTKFLPFGFAMGLSRRTYYLGTLLVMGELAAAHAALLTVLWWIEGLTHGWGMDLHFFRVPWLLDGQWYQIFITNFVLLLTSFFVGMWGALIYARFKIFGVVLATAVLVLVAVGGVLLITWRHWWAPLGDFFSRTDILAVTGIFAIVTALLAAGGYGTIRKITA